MPYAAVNGLDMYYEIHGEGSPLLLLHGGSDSIPEKWIPFFAPRFRVIAPEQMGHGRTADRVDRPFHYHDMAEDTVELMRQLGIESAAVVGYSDGGIIGLDMAIHHRGRVTKLAVTGANARFDGYTGRHQELLQAFDPARSRVTDDYRRLSPDGAKHWPDFLGRLKSLWISEPSLTNEQLRSIGTPVLLVIGDRDIVTPEHAVELFRLIPRARLCVVPNAGHGAMPKDAVLEFLQEEAASAG
ncbi:MAG TPA: alpha/beta hydrolase [Casimicrobiaceae bacterium]|nr:alpha/beta hydrolase [Casimicrobiaceae bacterium]